MARILRLTNNRIRSPLEGRSLVRTMTAIVKPCGSHGKIVGVVSFAGHAVLGHGGGVGLVLCLSSVYRGLLPFDHMEDERVLAPYTGTSCQFSD